MGNKKYPLGIIPSAPDPRDFTVSMPRAAMQKEIDLAMPPAYDQKDVGQCALFANKVGPHKYYGVDLGTTLGYGRWRSHDLPGMVTEECDRGFAKEGLPLLKDDPALLEVPDAIRYAAENADRLLPLMALRAGWTYAKLETVDQIRAALARAEVENGVNIVAVIRVSTYNLENGVWYNNDRTIGYHRVALKGCKTVKNAYGQPEDMCIIRNSWDTDWGDDGNCCMPWEQVLECNDVVAWFPPAAEPKEDKPVIKVRRTLRKGMQGDDVAYLQAYLMRLGFDLGKWGADGDFGGATKAAVEAFQRMHTLTVDGIVGPRTWAVIDAGAEWEEPEGGRKLRLLEHARGAVGQMYVWGGNGEIMTEKIIKRMENSTNNANRALAFFRALVAGGKTDIRGYDCSGLISRFLQDEGIVSKKRNSRHLYQMCKPLTSRRELKPFDLLFRYKGDRFKASKIYHVGVYIGNGMAIEAQGRDAGVVERSIDASGTGYWNAYGWLPCLED